MQLLFRRRVDRRSCLMICAPWKLSIGFFIQSVAIHYPLIHRIRTLFVFLQARPGKRIGGYFLELIAVRRFLRRSRGSLSLTLSVVSEELRRGGSVATAAAAPRWPRCSCSCSPMPSLSLPSPPAPGPPSSAAMEATASPWLPSSASGTAARRSTWLNATQAAPTSRASTFASAPPTSSSRRSSAPCRTTAAGTSGA